MSRHRGPRGQDTGCHTGSTAHSRHHVRLASRTQRPPAVLACILSHPHHGVFCCQPWPRGQAVPSRLARLSTPGLRRNQALRAPSSARAGTLSPTSWGSVPVNTAPYGLPGAYTCLLHPAASSDLCRACELGYAPCAARANSMQGWVRAFFVGLSLCLC